MRHFVLGALSLAGALSLDGCECSKISQVVAIAAPDAALQPLVDACAIGAPGAGESCGPMAGAPRGSAPAAPAVDCGCRALCVQVLGIIDQFPGPESLEACHVSFPAAGGAEITLTYRPSTCE
jgi:hypothetical protein